MQKIGAQVRSLQMLYNKVVSEGNRTVELMSGSPGVRVEIKPMDSTTFKVSTVGHSGPLKLVVEVLARGEGDRTVYIDRAKDVSEEKHIWMFKDKLKMILQPKKAYS
jgi:hypothetical protein